MAVDGRPYLAVCNGRVFHGVMLTTDTARVDAEVGTYTGPVFEGIPHGAGRLRYTDSAGDERERAVQMRMGGLVQHSID